jgi:hypothetical protein
MEYDWSRADDYWHHEAQSYIEEKMTPVCWVCGETCTGDTEEMREFDGMLCSVPVCDLGCNPI